MNYRPEIDGLRSLAVLAVVLYHAGAVGFSGGFVGVDIFFVISGYLITSLLLAELEAGRFSIADFYERRARRILPALFFVILCTLPFAWALLLPPQLADFSGSILSVLLFVSNIFFWSGSGYFDVGGHDKALLHTWSLAVEEQFYLLFPLVLLLGWKVIRSRLTLLLIMLAVSSFLFSLWQVGRDPSGNFYLLMSRAWELLGGAFCAVVLRSRSLQVNQGLGLAGLAMALAGVFLFDNARPWPSPLTLVPVVGAMLIILFARTDTVAGRFLSLRPMVLIGLMSYSLYLWHQPVLTFARLHLHWTQGSKRLILLALLCLPLAWASWRLVEKPFRARGAGWFASRRALFFSSGLVAGLLTVFAGIGLVTKGTMFRYPPEFGVIIGGSADKPSSDCLVEPTSKTIWHPMPHCFRHASGAIRPDVIILGDSHAWALSKHLRQGLQERGIGYDFAAHQDCLPVPGFVQKSSYGDPTSCMRFLDGVIDYARRQRVETLALVGRFASRVELVPFDNGEGGVEGRLETAQETAESLSQLRDRAGREITARLNALSSEFRLVIVEPIPEAGWNVPQTALARSVAAGRVVELTTSLAVYRARASAALRLLRSLDPARVALVDTSRVFCSEETGRCLNTRDGVPLYFDDDHLSGAGAALLAPATIAAIEASLQNR